ncbi:MAG TPA: SCP2 sterol-binding domain-containing protein [Acidimicrobiales bacterium]
MVRFLTAEWVAALDRAATAAGPCADSLDGLVVGYRVDGFDYHVTVADRRVRFRPGAVDDATVTFRLDRDTAAAIARGELSAQRAFMSGKLRIGGDTKALVRAQSAFAALGDVFAAVRSDTEW